VGVSAAIPHAQRALELAVRSHDPRLVAESSTLVELLNSLAGRGLALDAIGPIAGTVDASGPEILVHPQWSYGMLLAWSDRLDEARAAFSAMHKDALERGDEHSLPFILFHLARSQLLSGAWAEALPSARACVETTKSSGQASELPFACDIESLIDAHLGIVEPTLATITEGLELSVRYGVLPAQLEILATRGFLELSVGRFDHADRTLTEVSARAEESGFLEPGLFRFHGDAVEAKLALGQLDGAAALLDEIDRMAAQHQRASLRLIGGRGRGLLLAAQGQMDEAEQTLATTLTEDRSGQPFERARTLLAFGSVQRRNRQKRSARDALDEAQRFFSHLGAALWVERARAESTRIGGRAPADGLTPTELQIARLIAAGRTYREVAAELFISPKTVQWNLSKVYRKLDIQSRAELPGRLDAG
jgi:DNA-binding CsgD family transcriptional regulator